MYTYMYIHIHTYTHTHTCAHARAHTHTQGMFACKYCKSVHTFMHLHIEHQQNDKKDAQRLRLERCVCELKGCCIALLMYWMPIFISLYNLRVLHTIRTLPYKNFTM